MRRASFGGATAAGSKPLTSPAIRTGNSLASNALDEVDPALAGDRRAPGRGRVEPDRGDRAEPGDGDPPHRAILVRRIASAGESQGMASDGRPRSRPRSRAWCSSPPRSPVSAVARRDSSRRCSSAGATTGRSAARRRRGRAARPRRASASTACRRSSSSRETGARGSSGPAAAARSRSCSAPGCADWTRG